MTVIAWDGQTLAADKKTSFCGLHATTWKLQRVCGTLIGMAGIAAHIHEMHAWFEVGQPIDKFPARQREKEDSASILAITSDGKVWHYDCSPYPIPILNRFWAIGSGRDFAMMAMHLGKTAREAVEETCKLTDCCGNGIDTLTLEPQA